MSSMFSCSHSTLVHGKPDASTVNTVQQASDPDQVSNHKQLNNSLAIDNNLGAECNSC